MSMLHDCDENILPFGLLGNYPLVCYNAENTVCCIIAAALLHGVSNFGGE